MSGASYRKKVFMSSLRQKLCCKIRDPIYYYGPENKPDLFELLEETAREDSKNGFLVIFFACKCCGQQWRYWRKFVGHQEVEATLSKVIL